MSYIVFPNLSGKPNAQGCLEDVLNPLHKRFAGQLKQIEHPSRMPGAGPGIATESYLLESTIQSQTVRQENIFAFAGDANVCIEWHGSAIQPTTETDDALSAQLSTFRPELSYKPASTDYFGIGSLLFMKQKVAEAIPYYRSALQTLPADASQLTMRRVITDQLGMSLGDERRSHWRSPNAQRGRQGRSRVSAELLQSGVC